MATTIIDRADLIALVQTRTNDNTLTPPLDAAIVTSILTDEQQLDRILIARKYHAEPSVDLVLEQVRFRMKTPTVRPSDLVHALPSGAWRMMGYAKDGTPLSLYQLKYWNPQEWAGTLEETVEEYSKYVVYMIELMIASMKKSANDKFSVVFDLQGFYLTMATERNRRYMIGKLIYVAQSQYPERLQQVLLVNAPYGFTTAWTLVQALLDAKTASKIKFVNQEQMLDYVDKTVLTEDYGGTHAEYPVQSKTIEEEAKNVR